MAILLDVYNNMVKEAEETATKEMIDQRIQFLDKYASIATEFLQETYPNDFSQDDVVALADGLIQRDAAINEANTKTAEAMELVGEYVKVAEQLLKNEYKDDYTPAQVEKLADTLMGLDAQEDFAKEAEAIIEFSFLDECNKIAETQFTSMDELEESIKEAGMMDSAKGLWNTAKAGLSSMAAKANLAADRNLSGVANKMWRNPGKTMAIGAGAAGAAFVGGRMSKRSGGDN